MTITGYKIDGYPVDGGQFILKLQSFVISWINGIIVLKLMKPHQLMQCFG